MHRKLDPTRGSGTAWLGVRAAMRLRPALLALLVGATLFGATFIGATLLSAAASEGPDTAQAALPAQARSLLAQARNDPYVRYPAPPKAQASIKSLVGEVVNPQGGKLAQAVVHMKDKKTLEVKTRISDAEGKYVFRGLNRDADYEVHAEYQGASSPSKTVSQFDDRDEIYLTLEVPPK